jgi:CBS domain containing-hemolysin-like protein
MDRLGRIPMAGEAFEAAGFQFEVVDMDGRRVDKVLVKALPKATDEKNPPAGPETGEAA